MARQLDEIDQQILNSLTTDGRLTCAEIARAVGNISERAVRYRLDKLLEDDLVRVRGILNPSKFGYGVLADVVIEADPGLVLEIANAIAAHDCVTYVACLSGGSDIRAQVVARDNNELFGFVSKALGKIPGVQRITTAIVPHIVKETGSWRAPAACFE